MDRTGKRVRIILPNNIFYNGTIIEETDITITFTSKFNEEITVSKQNMVSMEVLS